MSIKKVRIKPPGYTDIVHPETSADVVKFSDGSTVEAHKAEDATQAHLPKNVGLGNVDNVKQASKTEFDEHDDDATRHITSVERTKWNTVDDKVDKVEHEALDTKVTSHLADNAAHGVDTKIPKSLATAANQFLVSSGASDWVIKTVTQVKELLGLKSAAYTESSSYATAAQGTKADNALPKSGGTMTGILTAKSNTSYTVRQVRNIILSNADANLGAMQDGDIWIKYK
jgi:hypothetical protein